MKKYILLFIIMCILVGCSSTNGESSTQTNDNVQVIIKAEDYSRITSEELTTRLGEPTSIEDYTYVAATSGETIDGTLYTFGNGKFEFIVADNMVVRLHVNSGEYWGYDDSTFEYLGEKSVFQMFNITPSDSLKKTADTGVSLRFSPVNDKVADLWIHSIEDDKFGSAYITFNLNFF